MGLLVNGQWQDQWYDTKSSNGKFERKASSFRNWVTPDGSAGPTGKAGFKAEAGRYHLYVSLACPWAHRTLIFRQLKGLQEMIGVSVVNAYMGDQGWSFINHHPIAEQYNHQVIADTVNQHDFLHQLYTQADQDYSGRVTVPVLWDKKNQTIVNNESAEIIRMFNSAFDQVGAIAGDYYPEAKRQQIDELNDYIYDTVNNGVYRAGFATTQQAYQQAVTELFTALEKLEYILATQSYLTGEQITEADWRLFTTLVRFDAVYVGHFKCNIKRLADMPNLSRFLTDLYHQPKVASTVNIENIKAHYYTSHPTINPTRIIPAGPKLDFLSQ